MPITTIGFISPPDWYDPAPTEFPTVVNEAVRIQQTILPLPGFDYELNSIASVQEQLNQCGRSLEGNGCEAVAQVGSPFAWAGATSEAEARARCESLAKAAGIPAIMTGLAIVDGLRALGVSRVSVDCTYYHALWRDRFRDFLQMCGFSVVHVTTLVDQGLVKPANAWRVGWTMTAHTLHQSILAAAQAAPEAEAVVVTGSGARTLDILADLEKHTGRPIIAADTILYWAAARRLNLTLQPIMGQALPICCSS